MKSIRIPLMVLFLLSCKTIVKPDAQQLLEIDRQFSDAASKKGFNKAFIKFAHPNAVLLRPDKMPITGKRAIISMYEEVDATGIDFSWEPLAVDIAASGDLGYTYGIYTIKIDTVTEKGTYVSIWKKDENGNWKYVLDTGNEGLGE